MRTVLNIMLTTISINASAESVTADSNLAIGINNILGNFARVTDVSNAIDGDVRSAQENAVKTIRPDFARTTEVEITEPCGIENSFRSIANIVGKRPIS